MTTTEPVRVWVTCSCGRRWSGRRMTPPFGAMVEKFLAGKRSEGKRSIKDDEERKVPLLGVFRQGHPVDRYHHSACG